DQNGTIRNINKAVSAYGYNHEELIGQPFIALIYYKDRDLVVKSFFDLVAQHKDYTRIQQMRVVTKTGEIRWFEVNCSITYSMQGQFILQDGVCRDITESIQNQHTLLKTQEELEEMVRNRTAELMQTNVELQREIAERSLTEKRLRERESELELEKYNLQETNTALQVLLKRREVDKHELEEQVMYNVKEFI
ncbi:MAG: PAS domain S-box protein, partial [Bacteroides sp.]|nr:PAS domain S-box protein [Bacteroides sp.]